MSTTELPSLQDRIATIDLSSRAARDRASDQAELALAAGDDRFAAAISRRILDSDLEHEQALDVLTCVLARSGRHTEAITILQSVLARFRDARRRNSTEHGLWLLEQRGFVAQGILDLGAYHGDFALFARQLFPAASVLMVEPQPHKQEFLLALAEALGGDCNVRSVVLGDRDGTPCTFHQMDTPFGSTGSSLYPELSEHARTAVRLPMRTCDSLLTELPGRRFDLVKLDVQGAELEVLRGARIALRDVEVMFVELSLHLINEGAPLFAEVVAELDRLGFALFDLLPLPRSEEGLQIQTDAIFVRKGSGLWRLPGTEAAHAHRA